MTTFQIQVDERVAEAVRTKARLAGKTPEVLAAEMVEQMAAPPGNKDWIRKFLDNAEKVRGNSGGWKWNREELYDRHGR